MADPAPIPLPAVRVRQTRLLLLLLPLHLPRGLPPLQQPRRRLPALQRLRLAVATKQPTQWSDVSISGGFFLSGRNHRRLARERTFGCVFSAGYRRTKTPGTTTYGILLAGIRP